MLQIKAKYLCIRDCCNMLKINLKVDQNEIYRKRSFLNRNDLILIYIGIYQ